ncbi:MAG: DUF4147 domain-containing protein [Alphaproteobacteria bacterium]|nr:DUF4147 domain-containing protein [Alphaproteobacteria bacterium]NNF70740.1 DUF4147 domain-containing protein [Paracoccaceae bacterium]
MAKIWWAGVHAVSGYGAVATALTEHDVPPPDRIVAVGKAAPAMAHAALDHFKAPIRTLVVTRYGHAKGVELPAHARVLEAAHPVPDQNSLKAGGALLAEISGAGAEENLLFLASGGASALAEVPADGRTLGEVVAHNKRLLASGLDIHAMNAERREVSQIKGGQLLARFPGRAVTSFAISDVEGDDLNVIGSGIGACAGDPRFVWQSFIVASNTHARAAAEAEARRIGFAVLGNSEALYGDVGYVALRLSGQLGAGEAGIRIWGGEPTVVLPSNPGMGGRNQGMALLLARQIAGRDGLSVLVAGTDGTDGPTDAAGAFVNGTSWDPAPAQAALQAADSGTYFAARGDLFETGPTGTNVMDLAISLSRSR